MSHRFYRDAEGDFRAECGRGRALLGRYLEAEIQGSSGRCDSVLAALGEVAENRRKRWRETGNAHTLSVGSRRARISAEFGTAPDLVLPLTELIEVLREWRELLES